MNKYTPFLKFKVAEIGALKALKDDEISHITPFFDLATKQGITSADIENTITRGVRKYELNFKKANGFYIDDYDIDDSILINGDIVYKFLIDKFQGINYIPVVGLDRSVDRINSISSPLIIGDTLAIRLTQDDFTSYTLIEDDINDLFGLVEEKYTKFHLILDCRLCSESNPIDLSNKIIRLINSITSEYEFEKIIIAGSSIHASIAEILPVLSQVAISRTECEIHDRVSLELGEDIELGDYTVISPNYSDANIPQAALRKIMTPKIIYSYDKMQHFFRGGAIETHPRGAKQYDDMSLQLVGSSFYRSKNYSVGDNYLYEKSQGIGTDALPHSIGKYLINAHMTFMIRDY
ncbi:TPA: beta family protein [Vibrio parahaemolyticus]|uniref:beta family protein n=1 Tax=Vibrio parahaemolyticus TaxID=670 RepID=UPI00235F44A2|nr:hypothetical protein [Vibrio parahaemolyticus]HCE2477631.1 beta family protein [Vibrio parahaemolyticus]HCE2479549.1 beta family protein [Vibrio parahaemolyticus]